MKHNLSFVFNIEVNLSHNLSYHGDPCVYIQGLVIFSVSSNIEILLSLRLSLIYLKSKHFQNLFKPKICYYSKKLSEDLKILQFSPVFL